MALDRERWMENNIPPPMPSTSRGDAPPDDMASVRDTLPRVNGAVAIGVICIKEEPESEDDMELQSTMSVKSLDKSSYKSSNKKGSTTVELPTTTQQAADKEREKGTPPSVPDTVFSCTLCTKTFKSKETLSEHIAAHKLSRPVLTPPSILREKQKTSQEEPRKQIRSTPTKDQDSAKASQVVTPGKTPEGQSSESRRSATPTKGNEKRPAKRQSETSILSIADNLLRRMTERTKKTEERDVVSTSEAEKDTRKVTAEDKEIHVETPQPESEEDHEVSFKDVPVQKEVAETETVAQPEKTIVEPDSTVIEPIEDAEPLVETPTDKQTVEKTSKSKSEKETTPKIKGKSTKKSSKSKKESKKTAAKKTAKDSPKKQIEEKTAPAEEDKSPAEKKAVSKKEATKKEATKKEKSKKEVTPDVGKPKESRKRGISPSKGTPSKKAHLEKEDVVSTPEKTEKSPKSPAKKSPKGDRLSKDEVADITKLARDLGCLRRSSRTKPRDEELNPTKPAEPEAREASPKKTAKSPKTPVPEKSHVKEPSPKKTTKATKDDQQKTPSKSVKEKPSTATEKEESKSATPKVKPKVKRQTTLEETFNAEVKKKPIIEEPTKEKAVSGKKPKETQAAPAAVVKKTTDKKTKEERAFKAAGTVIDKHVATSKLRSGKQKKTKSAVKEINDLGLEDVEMEAVEELVKLSQSTLPEPETREEKTKPNKKTSSASKVDDIYNRHVAALKGKINKRGKPKKNAVKNKKRKAEKVTDKEEEPKMTRIVGRKAYKMWLETQANVKDKTSEIAERRLPRQTVEASKAKQKQKKQVDSDKNDEEEEEVDDDEDSYVEDVDDHDDSEESFEHTLDKSDSSEPKQKRKGAENPKLDLECSKCKSPVTSRKEFNSHMMCNSPDQKVVACPVCAQTFRNKNRCWGHMVREHAGWKSCHECPYCYRKYSRKDAVQVHISSVHPKEHRQELAEKFGLDAKEAEEEEEFKDEDIALDLTCKRCNRSIQSKGDCYTHIMLHSPRGSRDHRRKVCPLCDKTAKDSFHIWEHVMVDHAEIKPFTCDQCQASFASEASLKKHQQTLHRKFLEPIAHVRAGFDSENWDIGMNTAMMQEPQGPLPLSSGNVVSLLELSLNTLAINQWNKIKKLNQLLTGQNTDLSTIISAIFSSGNEENEPKDTLKTEEGAKSSVKVESDEEEEEEEAEEGEHLPEEPAAIAARKMIPKDCESIELPCVLCPVGVTGSDNFKLHVLKHVCDSTRVCPVCRRTFSRKSSCRRHLVEHTFKWRHKCDLCSQSFPKMSFLTKHISKHLEQDFQCLNCLHKFDSEEELWQHVNPSRDLGSKGTKLGPRELVKFSCRRVHTCTKCHQEFRSAWGLQYHQENAHNDHQVEEQKPFQCNTCGKRFKSQITLRNHQEIHAEDASFLCRHCNLMCRTKRQLTKHIEYKHMEKIYKCSYCPKMFATRSRLKEHAIMHQNKTFICDMCGKVYRHQRVFETHCRQHFNPPVKKHRLYPCPECNHMSKSKEQLNLHMRRHTGERPYKCKLCPKAFSSQTGLWRHQMSHAGTKPHECHLCGKNFVQKCSLDRHLLSHAGIKPYACEYCGAQYSQSYPLTKHMERKHPGMPFVLIKKEDLPAPTSGTPAPKTDAPGPQVEGSASGPTKDSEPAPAPVVPALPPVPQPTIHKENDIILAQL